MHPSPKAKSFFVVHPNIRCYKLRLVRLARANKSDETMGRGGFEPPKCKHNRFTVCPFWPLRNLPVIKFKYQKSKVKMIMQNVKIF